MWLSFWRKYKISLILETTLATLAVSPLFPCRIAQSARTINCISPIHSHLALYGMQRDVTPLSLIFLINTVNRLISEPIYIEISSVWSVCVEADIQYFKRCSFFAVGRLTSSGAQKHLPCKPSPFLDFFFRNFNRLPAPRVHP